jgi:hypothetical protein
MAVIALMGVQGNHRGTHELSAWVGPCTRDDSQVNQNRENNIGDYQQVI